MGKQDALLTYAVSQSPAIFYIAELTGDRRVTFISPNVETITGHKPDSFLRDPEFGRRLLHPDDIDAYLEAVALLKKDGAGCQEYRFRNSSGDYLWFRDDLRVAVSGAGGPEQMVGCMIDITERKKAVAEQAKTSALLDDALEGIPHGFALYGEDDCLVRCNSAFASLYGVPSEALRGLSADEIIERAETFTDKIFDRHGAERDLRWTNEYQSDTARRHTDIYEMRVKDGRWFLVGVHHTGQGTIAVLRTDITAQKQAQAKVREAEALKAEIIDSALDCIITMDEEGRIIEFNPAAERTFGYSRDEALGQAVRELIIPEELRQMHDEGFRRFLRSGERAVIGQRVEVKGLRADGSKFPVEVSVAEVKSSGRRVFTAWLRDITEQKKARKERKQLIQMFHDAIESIPNGFAISDPDHRLVLCNTAYSEFYGVKPEELTGSSCVELLRRAMPSIRSIDGVPVVESDFPAETLNEYINEATRRPVEVELKDGRWVSITGHPTTDGGTVFIRSDITKAKQAEAALHERAQHYRRIVEGQPLPVWMAELESGKILYESPAATRLFGRSDGARSLTNVKDHYVDPSDRTQILKHVQDSGAVHDYELQLKNEDGMAFWISATCRTFELDGRQVIISSMIDLTERKQREAELRQARETLEDAIESLSEGFALYDAEDRLVMCNERYREFNEQSADMLAAGVRWSDFIRAGAERGQYRNAVGRVDEWIEERVEQRRQPDAKLEFQQSDGRWFEVSNQRTRSGGVVVTRSDITDRKQMEQALRESEALIRQVLEAAPLPVGMTRLEDGKIVYESPASNQLFHRGRPLNGTELASDYYANPEDREPYIELLTKQGFVDGYEVEFLDADGKRFWASLSARLIDYKGEKVIVSSVLDLTERRAVEAEMARQREALHRTEKLTALGSLLAGVAHELNNPLSVVVGQALLLQETAADPNIVKRATKIGAAADRCARIVRAFLAMARQRRPERAEIDTNSLITSIIEMLGYSLRTEGIELSVELAPDLPPVWADADQLNQVFVNLMVNAQQALAEVEGTRRIEIVSDYDKGRDRVRLRFSDNGPGIPDEIRSRVFDPFFTTKDVGSGTGIGLSVSYGIIESHGGTIELESRKGCGASFVVELPRARPEYSVASQQDSGQAAAEKARILIVDDEPEIAQTLREILVADGHDIAIAGSGAAALDLLDRGEFDVILCDLRMPDVDGRGLHAALRRRQPGLVDRMAFVTGDTFGNRAAEFLAETGLPCLEKPFMPDEVRRVVNSIMARPATLQ